MAWHITASVEITWRLSWRSVETSADQYEISHGHRKVAGKLADLLAVAVCCPQPPSVKLQEVLWSEVRGRRPSSPAVASPDEALWTVPLGTTKWQFTQIHAGSTENNVVLLVGLLWCHVTTE